MGFLYFGIPALQVHQSSWGYCFAIVSKVPGILFRALYSHCLLKKKFLIVFLPFYPTGFPVYPSFLLLCRGEDN